MADIERNEDVMEMAELQSAEDAERVSGEVVDDEYDDEDSGNGLAYVIGAGVTAAVGAAVAGGIALVKRIKKKRADKKASAEAQDKFAEERQQLEKEIAEMKAELAKVNEGLNPEGDKKEE